MTLPFGLYVCEVCGEVAGTVRAQNSPFHGRRSRCRCEGTLCGRCGRLLLRPTSDPTIPGPGAGGTCRSSPVVPQLECRGTPDRWGRLRPARPPGSRTAIAERQAAECRSARPRRRRAPHAPRHLPCAAHASMISRCSGRSSASTSRYSGCLPEQVIIVLRLRQMLPLSSDLPEILVGAHGVPHTDPPATLLEDGLGLRRQPSRKPRPLDSHQNQDLYEVALPRKTPRLLQEALHLLPTVGHPPEAREERQRLRQVSLDPRPALDLDRSLQMTRCWCPLPPLHQRASQIHVPTPSQLWSAHFVSDVDGLLELSDAIGRATEPDPHTPEIPEWQYLGQPAAGLPHQGILPFQMLPALAQMPLNCAEHAQIARRDALRMTISDLTRKLDRPPRGLHAVRGSIPTAVEISQVQQSVHLPRLVPGLASARKAFEVALPRLRDATFVRTHHSQVDEGTGLHDCVPGLARERDGVLVMHSRLCKTAHPHQRDTQVVGAYDRRTSMAGFPSKVESAREVHTRILEPAEGAQGAADLVIQSHLCVGVAAVPRKRHGCLENPPRGGQLPKALEGLCAPLQHGDTPTQVQQLRRSERVLRELLQVVKAIGIRQMSEGRIEVAERAWPLGAQEEVLADRSAERAVEVLRVLGGGAGPALQRLGDERVVLLPQSAAGRSA